MEEAGLISTTKARFVAQGINQEEGIYYEETFAPITRIKAIRKLVAFVCFKDSKSYQMDAKSA